VFGEATYRFSPAWALTGGLRYYDFSEDRTLTFAGLFADVGYTNQPGSTESDGFTPRVILTYNANQDVQFNMQMAKGFRLGGINDPLNVGLCSPADLITYGGKPGFEDEETTNYEIGTKTRFGDGRVTFNAAVFFTDIKDIQVVADAGTCSSRIILNGQARSQGAEFELFLRPNETWDFGLSATYADTKIKENYLPGQPLAGIREGNRLPTSPELQGAASIGINWAMGTSLESYVRFTAQYVGASFTQLADQEAGFGVISNAASPPAGAARLINLGGIPANTTINFSAELPSYSLGNLRWGIRGDSWETSVFINNLWDETAYLSIDRERGRSARVGYLTNQPRTLGVNFRKDF
jgi:iron complex outermembrane receptor protein